MVYLLGAFGVPTFIPYVAVMIAVIVDGVRVTVGRDRQDSRNYRSTDRGETIH